MASQKIIVSHIPNALTLCSVASAVTGILILINSSQTLNVAMAISCLCLSLILDRLDGAMARKLEVTSSIGAELDSLADLTAFGVFPVILFRMTLLQEASAVVIYLVSALYVVSAALRLARFAQVGLINHPTRGQCFLGVPTTAMGAASGLFVVLGQFVTIPIFVSIFFILILTYLMNSNLHYPKNGWGSWAWIIVMPLALIAIWLKVLVL